MKIKQKLYQQRKLFKKHGLTFVGLFGSVARQEFSPKSDVDLIFDYPTRRPPSLFQLGQLKEKLEKVLKRKIDLVSRKAVKEDFYRLIQGDIQEIYHEK